MTKRFTATTHNVFRLFVTLGPIGHLPFAPGTYGSAFACILLYFFPSVFAHPLFIVALIIIVLVVLNDPGYVVIDEVIGMFITMAGHNITFFNLLVGFILFRFFDIIKPYPIRRVEAFRKGYGIIADDIIAGIFANLLLIIGRRILQ
jgi:phosphatidylglycerophosphatase A